MQIKSEIKLSCQKKSLVIIVTTTNLKNISKNDYISRYCHLNVQLLSGALTYLIEHGHKPNAGVFMLNQKIATILSKIFRFSIKNSIFPSFYNT